MLDTFMKAFFGLRLFWSRSPGLKVQILIGGLLFFCAIMYPLPVLWKLLLIGSVLLLFVTEMFKIAVVSLAESVNAKELGQYADFLASAGVFLAYLLWGIVWASAMYHLIASRI